jgi:alkylated DNA repair dioxygenase AlkB
MHNDSITSAIERIPSKTTLGKHVQTIELADGGRLRHVPGFVEPTLATNLYQWLHDGVPWEQLRFRGHPEPRLTCWMADFPYRYSGVTRKPAPWLPLVRALASTVEKVTFGEIEGQFQGVLLNYYRSGLDKIGLHADAEPDLRPGAPIASLSLGATRREGRAPPRAREPPPHGGLDPDPLEARGPGGAALFRGSHQPHDALSRGEGTPMIPCKFCGPPVAANAALRGLKQVGKTRTSGTRFERRYRCQDCGAICIMRGDLAQMSGTELRTEDEWLRPPGAMNRVSAPSIPDATTTTGASR